MKRKTGFRAGCLCVAVLLSGAMGAWAKGKGEEPAAVETAPMAISWFGLYGGDIEEGNRVQRWLEEKFNVKLTNLKADATRDIDKLNLIIASGDFPDAMCSRVDNYSFFQKGAYRSIPRAMIRKYAPLYTRHLDGLGEGAWFYGLVPGKSEEYMGLVQSTDQSVGTTVGHYYRLDWLEKAGLGFDNLIDVEPTLPGHLFWWKGGLSFEKFEKILYTYRDGDFDGNGKADTIPFGFYGRGYAYRELGSLLPMWGINGVDNYGYQGNTYLADTHPKMKDALKTLQKWFRERLLDTELPNVTRDQAWAKANTGNVGAFANSIGTVAASDQPAYKSTYPPLPVVWKSDPKAKYVLAEYPYGPDGTRNANYTLNALPLGFDQNPFCIHRKVDDAKLTRILQIYDFVNYDDQGMVIAWNGWPGVDFEWAGEPWNSSVIQKPGWHSGKMGGIRYYPAYSLHKKLQFTFLMTPKWKAIYEYFQFGPGSKDATPAYREDLFRQTAYKEILTRYGSALSTIRTEFFWKAITTNMNIDAEWDAYVQKWMGSGGKEVLAELEKAPLVSDIRAGKLKAPALK